MIMKLSIGELQKKVYVKTVGKNIFCIKDIVDSAVLMNVG